MSGHNKWSKIKHKKASEDAKKSKVFGVLSQQIALESRAAKGDKNSPKLRAIIEKARKANMPGDNIERAVAKGAGVGGETLEGFLYEAYGPGGAAMVIEGITDNKNRSSQEIKHVFSKAGLALANPGSVTWAFTRIETPEGYRWKPNSPLELSDTDGEALAGLIEELEARDDVTDIYTSADDSS